MENKDHLTLRSQSSKWVAAGAERFNGYLSGAETHQGCGSLDSPSGAHGEWACVFVCVMSQTGCEIKIYTAQKICHLGKWLREILDTRFLWLLEGLVMNWESLGTSSVSHCEWTAGFIAPGPNTASIILNHFQPHLPTAIGTIKLGGHQREVLPLQIPVLLFSKPDSGNQPLCCAGRMIGMWPSFLEG